MKLPAAVVACSVLLGTMVRGQAPTDVQAAIGSLGALDYDVRTTAARTVRRVPATVAIPALQHAAARHADGYVRYKALILLAGFSDAAAEPIMRLSLTDENDRLRQVAYNFYQHRPEAAVQPLLLQALDREESEFVRPALMRALAAHAGDPKVRESLLVEVDRGVDFFRSIVIEALGDIQAQFAVPSLIRIAQLDGPLQDDAVLALGKIRDSRALEALASLQRAASRVMQPAIAGAICLLDVNCSSHERYLEDTLRFSIENIGYQDLLRSATSALVALALRGHGSALTTLVDLGVPATDPARAPIALGIGSIAMRSPGVLVEALASARDLESAVLLVRDGFDMLDEDFDEERFFVEMRRTFWESPEGDPRRAVAERLIQILEF